MIFLDVLIIGIFYFSNPYIEEVKNISNKNFIIRIITE